MPTAVNPFNFTGDVASLTHSRQYRLVKVVAADSTATATTEAFAALVSANPGVTVVSLEQLAAQVCVAHLTFSERQSFAKLGLQ